MTYKAFSQSLILGCLGFYSLLFLFSCSTGTPANIDRTTVMEETTSSQDCDGNGVAETYTIVKVRDRGEGTGTMTWTKNKTYILNGFVFVNPGQTLTIEAGTVIKGMSGQGEDASALIVSRGGRIIASGTAAEPIIFTAEADNIARDVNGVMVCSQSDLPINSRGLWGSIVVLGAARINSTGGQSTVEGIPTYETRGSYGGSNDLDDAGVLRYISLRHGGSDIGANNEINGLTLAGVGSGTIVEYIEVVANKDDGFEWFGGTVNAKYLISALNGDDAFDYDEGWRGKGQFWFAYQDDAADKGSENDGGIDPETATPYSTPVIYNMTLRGNNQNRAITFRDNAGGEVHNSILFRYGRGVDVELLGANVQDSYLQLQSGAIKFRNNLLFEVTGNNFVITAEDNVPNQVEASAQTYCNTYFVNNGNQVSDPGFINFVPTTPTALTAPLATDIYFTPANYKGAFAPGQTKWLTGWSLINQSGVVQ